MAYSKTLLLVGLLFAVVLIISSEVSARDLAEAGETQVSVEDAMDGGYGDGPWHGKPGHGKPGHGKPGHGEDVKDGEYGPGKGHGPGYGKPGHGEEVKDGGYGPGKGHGPGQGKPGHGKPGHGKPGHGASEDVEGAQN